MYCNYKLKENTTPHHYQDQLLNSVQENKLLFTLRIICKRRTHSSINVNLLSTIEPGSMFLRNFGIYPENQH